jgi:hypothetical protein
MPKIKRPSKLTIPVSGEVNINAAANAALAGVGLGETVSRAGRSLINQGLSQVSSAQNQLFSQGLQGLKQGFALIPARS